MGPLDRASLNNWTEEPEEEEAEAHYVVLSIASLRPKYFIRHLTRL
jgi:hypothetical protein